VLALPLALVLFGALPRPAGRALRLDLEVLRDRPGRVRAPKAAVPAV